MFNHRLGEFLPLGDARLYYETAGPTDAHPLLLLHGGMGSLEDFADVAPALGASFRLVGVDLRGHGRSSLGTAQLTYQQHASDVQALVNHLRLQNYSLLGFSDGGIAAYRIAAGNPAVRALATVGAQWRLTRGSPTYEMLAGVTPEGWTEMFPAAPAEYAALNPDGDFRQLVQACVALWTDLGDTGYPHQSVAQISCPTLIVRGDGDFLLSLSEAAEIQAAIAGASLANIPFAGHEALTDAPGLLGPLLQDFFARPRRAAPQGD